MQNCRRRYRHVYGGKRVKSIDDIEIGKALPTRQCYATCLYRVMLQLIDQLPRHVVNLSLCGSSRLRGSQSHAAQVQALHRQVRGYAIQRPGSPTALVFSNSTKYLQRSRAAANAEDSRAVDYLRDEVARRLCTRLLDVSRHFPKALDYGANACNIARILGERESDDHGTLFEPLARKIGHLTCADTSETMLYRDADTSYFTSENPLSLTREVLQSPEYVPFPADTFDLVLSSQSLHWVNDLPSVLTQINHCLKPDAPFIGAMSGGDTLFELRGSLQLAEQERLGGIATHVSPLADVRDIGNLLGRAGFKLLTVDVDDITVDYPSVVHLMRDLQLMGESNAALRREPGQISRDVLMATEAIYREMYGNEDGSIPATFRTIYMIGWKEGEGQAQPLKRGTGEVNLKDLLERGNKQG